MPSSAHSIARVALLLAVAVGFAAPAHAATPPLFKNCTNFNKKHPHGVGTLAARDKTKSGDPVTNFKRSSLLYLKAMSHNLGLDRDRDGIACEKH